MTEDFNNRNEPHALIVYSGGHGVSDQGNQMYLLNSNIPVEAMFDLERKLKDLIKKYAEKSRLKVFAIYDSDRLDINKI